MAGASNKSVAMATPFPKTLEGFGYGFNADGRLRRLDDNGRPCERVFEFNISTDPAYNQKHYEALGEVITEEVYRLLEKEGLKRLAVPPLEEEDGEAAGSFIFATEDSSSADRLLLLIHGTGVVRAGQWARSLIINDSLHSGTQLPYVRRAIGLGYGVIVFNTNHNYSFVDGKKIPIKGSSSPQEHANTVWRHYVEPAAARKIAIVAHSFGGIVTMSLASHFEDDFLKRVFAIALTDSVHGKIPRAVSSLLADHLAKVGRNWVSCSESLDKPMPEQAGEIPCVSAGTAKHELTSHSSMESVFAFMEHRLAGGCDYGDDSNASSTRKRGGGSGDGSSGGGL